MTHFLKRHTLIIGLALMFLYTWTIDLAKSGVLPFRFPFVVYLTLGWGFILVSLLMTGLTRGKAAVQQLARRFLIWRVGLKWFLAALLIEPACILASVYLQAALSHSDPDFSLVMARQLFGPSASLPLFILPFFLVDLITNGEEMGWRGYVLPRLQARHSALTSSLILGVIWGFWHLPKQLPHFSPAIFAWSMLHFMAFAILLTWLYNNTEGSLLLVALCHSVANTAAVFMPIANTGVSASTGAYIFYVIFEVVAAIIVTITAGPRTLSLTYKKQTIDSPEKREKMKFLSAPNKPLKVLTAVLLAALILACLPGTALAQGETTAPSADISAAPSRGEGPTDQAELEAFLDALFARDMEENHIAGAAVAVVKDGQLFFTKGYGYADIENNIPVDPEKTLFKLGSVTKLFTWMAVMQLVEKGSLDLDADINTYLDFRIPDTFPQPITLKHLMAHTSGFEDLHADLVALEPDELLPGRGWLATHIPARVRPPGESPAYSNYNAALAGYIVARAADQPFGQYVQEHILDPLGMNYTTVQQVTPSGLKMYESVGYMYADGSFQVFPQLYNHEDLFPAGVMRSTAADMARFMIAHLQNGRYSADGAAESFILGARTARRMHTTLYTPHPRLLGSAFGFFEFDDNGQRVIGHSGSAEPMESMLLLLPDLNMGVFVAYNSLGAGELNRQHFGFQRAFFDHYFLSPELDPIQPPADFASRAGRFTGAYKWTMSSYTTFEKFFALMGPTVYVKDPGDGTLLLETPFGEWRIVEKEPLYFRQVDGPYHMAFRTDDQGRIVYLFTDLTPMMAFEKIPWYETLAFNMVLLVLCLLAFVSMLLAALVRVFRRRRLGAVEQRSSRSYHLAMLLIVVISLLNLLFITGNLLWGEQVVFGIPAAYKVVLGMGVLSAVLTTGTLVFSLIALKTRSWGAALRVHYAVVTLAAMAFVWFLNQWNLLGWRF